MCGINSLCYTKTAIWLCSTLYSFDSVAACSGKLGVAMFAVTLIFSHHCVNDGKQMSQ